MTLTSVDIIADPVEDPMDAQVAALQAGGVDKNAAPAPEEPGAESLLAGKFKSQEDLEKAYLELQQKFSEKGTKEPKDGKDPAFQINKEGEPEEKAAFNAAKYQQEFMEQGSLSEDSIKELQALGIPNEMIDTHVAGLQAIKEARASAIRNIFGGDERMGNVLKWAGANLSEQEIVAIETQANSTDMAACEAAIKGLVARFDGSPMGQTNALEGRTGGPAIAPFKSNAEMTAAIGDPRYRIDEGYRADVQRRITAT